MVKVALSCGGFVLASVMVAGCGGGTSEGTRPVDAAHSTSLGEGTITYFGHVIPAQTFSMNGVSIAAMAGANFTNVTLNPAPKLTNSLITFIRGGQIWAAHNGAISEITHFKSWIVQASPSRNGQIVFVSLDAAQSYQLFTCNFDGSAITQITSSGGNPVRPSWSPSGSKIVFESGGSGDIYTVNANGSGLTNLAVKGRRPVWSPDGTKIALSADLGGGGGSQIYTVPAAGGAYHLVSTFFFGAYVCLDPAWSPDGSQVAFVISSGGNSNEIAAEDSAGGPIAIDIAPAPSATFYHTPSYAPDGNSLVFQQLGSAGSSIVTAPYAFNSSVTPIASSSNTALCEEPKWSGYFAKKSFVGAGGVLPNASGFIWTQLNGFSGFLAFTASTPSTATITSKDANSSSGTGVFLIKADSITKINYTNSYFGAIQTLAPATPQVLVSISATDGTVDTIAPLTIARNEEPVKSVKLNGHLVYKGHFVSINRGGKNIAPGGASQLEIDQKSGKLVSWR